MTSDIILKQDRIEAITTNESFLGVTTGENKRPDIFLAPNSAALKLGGGDGDYSDGDIRLFDRPGDGESKPRIHLTGGTGATESGTRVRVNGKQAIANLGATSADDPDIQLQSNRAQLRLGGGAGDPDEDRGSVGNIRLDEENENPRVFVAAGGSAPPNPDENAVYVTGGGLDDHGQIALKRIGESFADATVTLDAQSSQLSLGSQTGSGDIRMYRKGLINTLSVDGHNADVFVGGSHPSTDEGVPGSVHLYDEEGDKNVSLTGEDASVSVGDGGGSQSDGTPGTIELVDSGGTRTGLLAGGASGADGASLSLGHKSGPTTVDAEGGQGRLRLGNGAAGSDGVAGEASLVNAADNTTVTIESEQGNSSGAGLELGKHDGTITAQIDGGTGTTTLGADAENGTLSLEDGAGMLADLVAKDGVVTLGHHDDSKGKIGLELEPENGIFSIVDGDGDAVFQIDTQAKTIKKGQKYKRGVIGHGP